MGRQNKGMEKDTVNLLSDKSTKQRNHNVMNAIPDVGGLRASFVARFLIKLVDGTWLYLLGFIVLVLFIVVSIFWVLFAAMPDEFGEVEDLVSVFALSMSSLFGTSNPYTPNSSSAVIIQSLETLTGILVTSALTALLVKKLSMVPNHLVMSEQILLHKHNGKWAMSLRLGVLNRQQIHNLKISMIAVIRDNNGLNPYPLKLDGLFAAPNGIVALPLPYNVRHIVDESSPLYGLDTSELRRKVFLVDVFTHGFDDQTGRSVGNVIRYMGKDRIIIHQGAKFASSYMPVTECSKPLKKSCCCTGPNQANWVVDWSTFNTVEFEDPKPSDTTLAFPEPRDAKKFNTPALSISWQAALEHLDLQFDTPQASAKQKEAMLGSLKEVAGRWQRFLSASQKNDSSATTADKTSTLILPGCAGRLEEKKLGEDG